MVTGAPRNILGGFLAFMMFEVILLVPGRLYPQVVRATLSGTVTDQSDAVVSNTETHQKHRCWSRASSPGRSCRINPLSCGFCIHYASLL
jgi:hypothetical protein